MKKVQLLLVAVLLTPTAYSQNAVPAIKDMVNIASPNAAGLGTYGEVPINLSTGQLEVNIPIYTLSYHDINLPISLSYNNEGFKPNDHPSWVGLGWNLNAGGAITRIRHGEADEMVMKNSSGTNCQAYGYIANTTARGLFNNIQPPNINATTFNQMLSSQRFFDLTCNGLTNSLPYDAFDTEPDEFIFNFCGFSGKMIYKDNQFLITTTSSEIFSATMTLGTNLIYSTTITVPQYIKGFTITTYDGYKYEFGGDFTNDHNIEFFLGLPSSKYGSTNNYERGNNLFSTTWYLSKITSPKGLQVLLNYGQIGYYASLYPSVQLEHQGTGATPKITNYNTYSTPVNTTSYLESIVAGDETITFSRHATSYDIPNGNNTISAKEQDVPDYLNLLKIPPMFTGTPDVLKPYNDLYGICDYVTQQIVFHDYAQKLEHITIERNNSQIKKYTFDYYTKNAYSYPGSTAFGGSITGRLELKDIVMSGSDDNYSYNYYSFMYHTGQTAPYGTRKVDHWGYYNAQDYFNNINDTATIAFNASNIASLGASYYATREPNSTTAMAGLLTRITYPTGGYTQISYEPNYYLKYQSYDLSGNILSLATNSAGAAMGPGLRVSSTTNTANFGAVPIKKDYYYTNDYLQNGINSNVSSGILNSGIPKYYQDVFNNSFLYGVQINFNQVLNPIYQTLSSESSFPNNFEGAPITYSTVVERDGDGSFKLYKYSNSDVSTNYLDKIYTYNSSGGNTYNNNGYGFQWYWSLSSERGKILEEDYYDNLNQLSKKTAMTYNNDPSRFDNCVSYMKKNGRVLPLTANASSLTPYFSVRSVLSKYFGYYDFLKDKTETEYRNGVQLVYTHNYTYDAFRNVLSENTITNSAGDISISYKYPNSYTPPAAITSDDDIEGIRNLQNKGIVRYPIEIITTKTLNAVSSVIAGKVNTYNNTAPIIKAESILETQNAIPVTAFTSSGISGNSFVMDTRYNVHKQNITQFSPGVTYAQTIVSNGEPVSLMRDYLQKYVTAKATNAQYAEIGYTSFEGIYANTPNDVNKCNWDFTTSGITSNSGITGNNCYNMASGNITFNGSLQAGKTYLIVCWQKNGNVNFNFTPSSSITGNTVNGWQKITVSFVAQASQNITINGTGLLDELKIYPANSQFETYSFDNNSGNIISMADTHGQLFYYEYDDLGRLLLVRDADNNIIKKYQYGLQNQE